MENNATNLLEELNNTSKKIKKYKDDFINYLNSDLNRKTQNLSILEKILISAEDNINKETLNERLNYFINIPDTIEETIKNYNAEIIISQQELEKMRETHKLELELKIKSGKQERRVMWLIWFQKLIRGCIGLSIIVVLYSCFVYFASNYDFIVIPIKDWISISQVK
jgi:HD-GYP domain-containing protein (c-di-GMP phosphodiesterase class II)